MPSPDIFAPEQAVLIQLSWRSHEREPDVLVEFFISSAYIVFVVEKQSQTLTADPPTGY